MKKFPVFFTGLLFLSATSLYSAQVTIGSNGEFLLDKKPFFPIMQWLQSSSRVPEQALLGINLFCLPGNKISAKDWCDVARANNVYACCAYNAEDVPAVINNTAFFGWFFGDEPDHNGNQIKPDSIAKTYHGIKAADPNHPAFLTITSGFFSEQDIPAWMNGSNAMYHEYPKYTDVLGFDLYPIYGWCRPDWIYQVSDAVQELQNEYIQAKKPVYAWIECMKTSSRWCNNSSRGTSDGPYPYETEAQVWLAIIHGAKAIGYFSHSWECPGYSQWCVSDEMKQKVSNVNSTITALTDVICAADLSGLNVTVNGISGNNGRVDACAKAHGDSIYIIATNVINMSNTAAKQRVTFTIPNGFGPITVFGENRTISPSLNGVFSDTFTTEQPVHIYAMKSSFSTPVKSKNRNTGSIRRKANPKVQLPFGSEKASDGVKTIMDLKGAKVATGKTYGKTSSTVKIVK